MSTPGWSGSRHAPAPVAMDMTRRARQWEDVVLPQWEARLLPPLVEALTLPERGSALVAECRTGFSTLRLLERLSPEVRCIALDPSREMLDLARAKLHAEDRRVWWESKSVEQLTYRDGVFGASLCAAGLTTRADLRRVGPRLVRLTMEGGAVGVAVPLRDTFTAFYDLFREGLQACDLLAFEPELDRLQAHLCTLEDLPGLLEELGLQQVEVHTLRFDVTFASGQEFLLHPLVEALFLPRWMHIIRDDLAREQVFYYVAQALDTYFTGLPLSLGASAAWATGVR